MNLIVAVDKNWAIGKENKLLVSIPADMKFFRQETTGKVVVMGRKTLESFPGGLPLKNRTNIVLTRDKNYQAKGAVIVHTLEELLKELEKYPAEEVYCIGGESIYRLLLPYCDTAHITKIDYGYEADRYSSTSLAHLYHCIFSGSIRPSLSVHNQQLKHIHYCQRPHCFESGDH